MEAVILKLLESEAVWALLIAALAWGAKQIRANMKAEHAAVFDAAVGIGYLVVAEVARRTPNKLDDKAALALGEVNKHLVAKGHKPMTPAEELIARQKFDALHALEKKEEAKATLPFVPPQVGPLTPPYVK